MPKPTDVITETLQARARQLWTSIVQCNNDIDRAQALLDRTLAGRAEAQKSLAQIEAHLASLTDSTDSTPSA